MAFKKKLFLVYLLVLLLGGTLSLLIKNLGQEIMYISTPLIEKKLPLLQEVSDIQIAVAALEPILYEYYATTDKDVFTSKYEEHLLTISTGIERIRFTQHDTSMLTVVDTSVRQLDKLGTELLQSLAGPSRDWDKARELLKSVTEISNQLNQGLDRLVSGVEEDIQGGGKHVEEKINRIVKYVVQFSVTIFFVAVIFGLYINTYLNEAATRKRLAKFVERNPLAVFELTLNGDIVYANPAVERLLSKLGKNIEEKAALLPLDLNERLQNLRESLDSRQSWEYKIDKLTLKSNVHFLSDLSAFHLHIEDVTKIKQAEIEVSESQARYRSLYDDNPSMYFTLDIDGKILSVNRFGAEQLGYEVTELEGFSVFDLLAVDDERQALNQCLSKAAYKLGETHRYEVRKVCKGGKVIWVRETVRAVADASNSISFLVISENVTKEHALSVKLAYQATHDKLTGLYNRAEFERLIHKLLETSRKEMKSHVLCFVDLDQFKVINDTCGHIAGDELLRLLGAELNRLADDKTTIARLGGDEFGVLFEDCFQADAWRRANEILKKIQDFQFFWDGKSYEIGASIGLVPIDETSENVVTLLSQADTACYAAKDEGRNRVHVYYLEDDIRRDEMQWIYRINEGLENERFDLFFQLIAPVQDVSNCSYCELLVRMYDESGKLIPPGAFLPAAERYGLMSKLDKYVVNKAFTWLGEHAELQEQINHIGINLSGQSLADEGLLTFLMKKLDEGLVSPDKICFEITESAAIASLDTAINLITKLKERGCRFALDDFGTGLSSFAYLKNMPVDYLKIDGSFVKNMIEDEIDFAMVRSINEIGQVMGMKTIAEYVEDEKILKGLAEIGVDYAQGYGIAKPQPLVEYEEFLSSTQERLAAAI